MSQHDDDSSSQSGTDRTVEGLGILHPNEAAKKFRLRLVEPCGELQPFVENHWIIRWDLGDGEVYESAVLPHPTVNAAFLVEGPLITGVSTGTYNYRLTGQGVIVGTRFRPGCFRPFFDSSVDSITDQVVPMYKTFPLATEMFADDVRTSDDEHAGALMNELLKASLPHRDERAEDCASIVQRIATDRSMQSVTEVASAFHLGVRNLQALFQEYVGVGPKWVIRRYRLLEAVELAHDPTPQRWAEIAHDLGYTDHAHLINDFKTFTDTTPAKYVEAIHG